MGSTDFCPNCGMPIRRSVDHRCSSNEDVNKELVGDKVSTSALDNRVKGSKSHVESPSKLEKRENFSSSDNEEFQEHTFKKVEDEYELENLKLKKIRLESEGNSISPTNEEGHEDASEVRSSRFLSIDPSLCSGEPASIVSQRGIPLHVLPFEHLVTDESKDRNQNQHKNADARRWQSISHDATTAKNRQNSGVAISKSGCGGSFPSSFPGIHEHQNTCDGVLCALPCDNQASPSKINHNRHSSSTLKKSPLKHSSQKSQCYGQSGMITSAQKSNEALIALHDHQYTSEGVSSTLASGRQACPSSPDHSEVSRAEFKTTPLIHLLEKSHLYGKSTTTCSAQISDEAQMVLHDHQYTSKEESSTWPSGKQACPSSPDHNEHSRAEFKTTPLIHLLEKSHRYVKSTMTCSAQISDEAQMVLHDHQYTSKEDSSTWPSGRQACPPDHSERSTSESKWTPEKYSDKKFSCDDCDMTYSDRKSLEDHMILRHHQDRSKGTKHRGSQARTPRPDQSHP